MSTNDGKLKFDLKGYLQDSISELNDRIDLIHARLDQDNTASERDNLSRAYGQLGALTSVLEIIEKYNI